MSQNNRISTLKEGDSVASGDYTLQRRLGGGGFGEVWLATNVQLQKPVALKFFLNTANMAKELDSLVVDEGRKLAQLTQGQRGGVEHILIVHRHVISDRECPAFLELEFMEGGSLYNKLREKHTLPEEEVVALAIQVGMGLQCAHHHKIIHSDLKPDNILMDGQRRFYKLGDFGLARRFEDMLRVRAGSPPYMSPEQFDAPQMVSTPTDVYALGVVMYECIEGHPPFGPPPDGKRQWEHYHEHCKKAAPRPRNNQVSEDLKNIILHCLAKPPKDRPTLADLIARLRDIDRGGVRGPGGGILDIRDRLVWTERGGRKEVRNTITDLRFLSPSAQAPYYVPQRTVNNRDFLHFIRDPKQSRWNPQQVPIYAQDGGYLKSWFQGQPLKGEEEDMLASVPYEAALDFCRWSGGELPDVATVEKLLTTEPELPIARSLRERQERQNLPYLMLWCRVEGLESDRDGTLYRFGLGSTLPVEMSFHPFLRRVRRPRNYCFPFYTFFPVIPSEVVTNLPRAGGEDDAPVTVSGQFRDTDIDKTVKASHVYPLATSPDGEPKSLT